MAVQIILSMQPEDAMDCNSLQELQCAGSGVGGTDYQLPGLLNKGRLLPMIRSERSHIEF